MKTNKKTITLLTLALVFAFIAGACVSQSTVATSNTAQFDIFAQDGDSNIYPYIIVDKGTGINYIVVYAESYGMDSIPSVTITPRLAAGSESCEYYKTEVK